MKFLIYIKQLFKKKPDPLKEHLREAIQKIHQVQCTEGKHSEMCQCFTTVVENLF